MANLVTLNNLLASSNYFFYVVACDSSGIESRPSNVMGYSPQAISTLKLTRFANGTMSLHFWNWRFPIPSAPTAFSPSHPPSSAEPPYAGSHFSFKFRQTFDGGGRIPPARRKIAACGNPATAWA
jgi:hypothetical protein